MVPLSENVNPRDEDGASLPLRVIDSTDADGVLVTDKDTELLEE